MRLAFALLVFGVVGSSAAQTGPTLMLKPFAEGQSVEAGSEVTILSRGETRGRSPDTRVGLVLADAEGRWRITGEDAGNLTLGMAITELDLNTSSPYLPESFTDQSFALGGTVGTLGDWRVDLLGGLGYAGSNPYADGDAAYARADLMLTRQLDERSRLLLGLGHHGNRTIWPDLPLPGFAYTHQADERLAYTIGVPFSRLTWRPAAGWTLDLDYTIPTLLAAKLDFEVLRGLHLFSAYARRVSAFVLDGDADHRRFFFDQSRAEAGIRWEPCAHFGIEAAGGYAFSQEFERGYDVRDTDRVVDLSDEPYLRVGLNVGF